MICGSMARSFGSNSRVGQLSMIAGAIAEPSISDKRLGGEDDGRILLAKRLQPLPQLAGKILVVERQPAFIDDEQRWPAVKPSFDAMEQIGKHGRRGRRADQPFGLKDLDRGFAKALELGIKQPAIGPAEAIGLQARASATLD